LREIGEALKEDDSPIAVEGHTDNVPIHTVAFPSNWELATARATTIVRYLIDDRHYDPARLSATGFGEFRPTGDNTTAEGRGLNRRVDLVVLTEGSEGPPPRCRFRPQEKPRGGHRHRAQEDHLEDRLLRL